MAETPTWRCPICRELAASGAQHLRETHQIGIAGDDRLGLRQAVRPAPPPPRRLMPTTRRRSRREIAVDADTEIPPASVAPLPPDAAVLRLVCETLEGQDAGRLQARLVELAGVESAAIDLHLGCVDLFIDAARASPMHLVTLATERLRLPLIGAEIHRRADAGRPLGEDTRLGVLF